MLVSQMSYSNHEAKTFADPGVSKTQSVQLNYSNSHQILFI